MLNLLLILCIPIFFILVSSFINRSRMPKLIKEFDASTCINTLWFLFKGIQVLLVKTTDNGAYLEKGIKDLKFNRFWPFFELIIPISDHRIWSITKIGNSFAGNMMKKYLLGEKIIVDDQEYLVWAHEEQFQKKIISLMATIAPLIDSMSVKTLQRGRILSDFGPLFYNWALHMNRFVRIADLPEGLNENPQELRLVIDNTLKILDTLGIKYRT